MKALLSLWKTITGLGIIFSSRPVNNYGQYLTDTVKYHH